MPSGFAFASCCREMRASGMYRSWASIQFPIRRRRRFERSANVATCLDVGWSPKSLKSSASRLLSKSNQCMHTNQEISIHTDHLLFESHSKSPRKGGRQPMTHLRSHQAPPLQPLAPAVTEPTVPKPLFNATSARQH